MADTIVSAATDHERRSEAHEDGRIAGVAPWPLAWHDIRRVAASAVVLLLAVVLAGFGVKGLAGTRLGAADTAVNEWFAAQRTPAWNELSDWGSALSDTITIVLALVILIPLLVLITRRWIASALLAGAVAVETLVS